MTLYTLLNILNLKENVYITIYANGKLKIFHAAYNNSPSFGQGFDYMEVSSLDVTHTNEEHLLTDKDVHVVLFVSRNKDNISVNGFKERRQSFLTTENENSEILHQKFEAFKNNGLKSELSRMYYTVNARDVVKIKKGILQYLIAQDDVNLAALGIVAVAEAMKKDNTAEKNILFDLDFTDPMKLNEFIQDLVKNGLDENVIKVYPTINGYSVVTPRGAKLKGLVDTMPDFNLEEKKDKGPWKWSKDEVTYKLDALVLLEYGFN